MSATAEAETNRHLDDHVDDELAGYLNLEKPTSFFLFAGAGSGKTRSLVNGLRHIQRNFGSTLRLRGQRVAVITYTNAARDEILARIEADTLFHVATIHSFVWTLIQGFDQDIRAFLRDDIATDIRKIEEDEAKGRAGTKASLDRQRQIESKRKRLARLDTVKSFTYNPNGDNRDSNSLSHAEVIAIAAHFLNTKPTMRRILTLQYPILLVDESQDTKDTIVDALLLTDEETRGKFCLGFFGDIMQRIYNEGKSRFEEAIPATWAKPEKQLNHRCPRRVLRLINEIRKGVDHHLQVSADTVSEGLVRIFLLPSNVADKPKKEQQLRERMAEFSGDDGWNAREQCKILALEHLMAAKRMGFAQLFESLSSVSDFRTGLLDGSLPATRLFAKSILTLVRAEQSGDRFAVARVVREDSPLIESKTLRGSRDAGGDIRRAREAVQSLLTLWQKGVPSCGDVLRNVARSGLFSIPEILQPFAGTEAVQPIAEPDPDNPADDIAEKTKALEAFLATSFEEVAPYANYISGRAPYDTHQGVKGREFDRVMVLIDDGEARGFLFGYEKLLGAKEQSATDIKNAKEGRETSNDRTRRLLYVTCSRAKKSLSLVVYSANPAAVRQQMLNLGWFGDDEIVLA